MTPMVTLHQGDSRVVLSSMESGSVDCCVTSPPYYGLRDYLVDGQIGNEATPGEYVANLSAVFAQVHRVLAADGTLWLNLGDSYRSKNLLGMPWRVAFALQDAGWILRNAIVWEKPNAIPDPALDRLSTRYEMIFLLCKSKRYWFDVDPIRVAHITAVRPKRPPGRFNPNRAAGDGGAKVGFPRKPGQGRNPGNVWSIPTTNTDAGGHFACFPPELPRRCILSGCKPGGTVLDPFHGSGTTGMVARELGRNYVGIELNQDYIDLSLRTRLQERTAP